jgi:nucleoside-diphosphate-sugar epimerase
MRKNMVPHRVFVSGGSGYIAGFLIRQLISEGWTVHPSIRDLAREGALRATLAVEDRRLNVFASDLMHNDGWAARPVEGTIVGTAQRHQTGYCEPLIRHPYMGAIV